MALRGVSSEGNATMRLLFENLDLSSSLTWISQQYVYLDLAAVGILVYFLAEFEERIESKWVRMRVLPTAYTIVIAMTWFFAAVRLCYGPPGNTFTILLPYGEIVALVGAFALFLLVLWIMLSDMKLGLIRRYVFHSRG